MEASDLLDVIHYYFEEDSIPPFEGAEKARVAIRSNLYSELYGHPYAFGTSDSGSSSKFPDGIDAATEAYLAEELPAPFNPRSGGTSSSESSPLEGEMTHKGYVPATSFDPSQANPFEGVLMPPAG